MIAAEVTIEKKQYKLQMQRSRIEAVGEKSLLLLELVLNEITKD